MKALVTGGGGFLGSAIVRQLLGRGDSVRSISRGDYPELRALGVETFQSDLSDPTILARAASGCDVVFHVAAKAGIWGAYDTYHRANVSGTQHVIEACKHAGVSRLVFTSSPSVVFDGRDVEGADESLPYPKDHHAPYPATKAEAERLVLAANSPTLATVALRPHLIWGPGDNHLAPRIIAKGKAGRLRRIGKENKLVDSIYIDNAAEAHLLAADRLHPGSPPSGKAYFLSQGEPWPIWELVNAILETAGVPPVTKSVPSWVALTAGGICEAVYKTLRIADEPPMTRFLAAELATSHYFNIDAARRDLGYAPRIDMREGLRRLKDSFKA